MYDRIEGTLVAKGLAPLSQDAYAVVQTGGIGYSVTCPQTTLAQLPDVGSPVCVFVRLIVRQDEWWLAGFQQRVQRDLFVLLLGASGMGPKMALSLCNALPVSDVVQAIVAGNHKPLTVAKGIGPKLAQKVVLELKDKLTNWQQQERDLLASLPGYQEAATPGGLTQQAMPIPAAVRQEAELVLLSLGYNPAEIARSFNAVAQHQPPAELDTLSSEALLRATLHWLAHQVG